MLVAISYDISDDKRRYHVSRVLKRYGERVQKSVFEAHLQPKQFLTLKKLLLERIDPITDSLRYYNLGETWRERGDVQGSSEVTPELEFVVI